MNTRKLCLAAVLLLALLSAQNAFAENDIIYIRGDARTETVELVSYPALDSFPPTSSTQKTTYTKTTSKGVHELKTFFSAPTGEETGTGFALSGSQYMYFSSIGIQGDTATYRWKAYDYNSDDETATLIAQSGWFTLPKTGSRHETFMSVPEPYTIAVGHRGKLVLDYNAQDGGGTITMVLDEGAAGKSVTYQSSSNDLAFTVNDVNNTAMLLLNAIGTCSVACSNSLACNDSNPETTDTCVSAGGCNSYCTNVETGAEIACSADSECDDGNTATIDTCVNLGTAESSCKNEEQDTEPIEVEEEVVCYANAECDDGIGTTTDTCKNAGTTESYCSNEQCAIACSSNESCDDGNPLTNDSCVNPGTCDAACSNSSCNPVCTTNSDCDDANPATTDVCAGAGRCTATCENLTTTVGDGVCEGSETKCSAPGDCGACSGSLSEIYENACIGNACQTTIKLGVCGNNRCESGENFFNCESDCVPQEITIEAGFPDTFYARNETVHVKATVVVDGENVGNALVRASGFFGDAPLLNDGRHGDGTRNDNIYANSITIGGDVNRSLYPVTITAEIGGATGKKIAFMNVVPKLSFAVQLDKEFYILGDNLSVEGTLSLKDRPLSLPLDLNFQLGNEVLEEKNIIAQNGRFSASYRTTLIDEDGNYTIRIASMDGNGNTGVFEKSVPVLSPEATNFLVVDLNVESPETGFRKGTSARVTALVKDIANAPIEDAEVTGITGTGFGFEMAETGPGRYEGGFTIPNQTKSGELMVSVRATKQNKQGSASLDINVLATGISVEVLEPQNNNFLAGEEIRVRAKASYEDGSPVVSEKIFANVNGQRIELTGIDRGIYEGTYIVRASDEGTVSIRVDVDDGYSNTASESFEVEVTGISYLYYLRTFGVSIALFAVAAIITLVFGLRLVRRITGIEAMKKKEKRIIETIKGIQTQYFVEGSIDRKTYDKYMEKYEAQLDDVRTSIQQATLKGKK